MSPKAAGKSGDINEQEALPPQIVAQAEAAILGNSGDALHRPKPSRAHSERKGSSLRDKSGAGLSRLAISNMLLARC